MTSRIVYIRDPSKNYQFVPFARAVFYRTSKGMPDGIPIEFERIEGPFQRVTHTYMLVKK